MKMLFGDKKTWRPSKLLIANQVNKTNKKAIKISMYFFEVIDKSKVFNRQKVSQ